jgi:large subunit ribosomal protein L11
MRLKGAIMATKTVRASLKMKIRGGQASAAPPVGSTLGQYGVNMMDFINPFNEHTKDRMGQTLDSAYNSL